MRVAVTSLNGIAGVRCERVDRAHEMGREARGDHRRRIRAGDEEAAGSSRRHARSVRVIPIERTPRREVARCSCPATPPWRRPLLCEGRCLMPILTGQGAMFARAPLKVKIDFRPRASCKGSIRDVEPVPARHYSCCQSP